MYTLIAFATQWGSRHGGINSFNADFLMNFGAAYHQGAQIVCVVPQHTPEALEETARANVRLVALPYVPASNYLDSSLSETVLDCLRRSDITFAPEQTIWLGHDLITGDVAVGAARAAGGRSAVIHHMSYSDYESYAEDTASAQSKTEKQTAILKQADLVLAIGPLLRNAAYDRLEDEAKPVHMLIPGLPEIDSKDAPTTFTAFLSGRLTTDAARIKQGHLGIAAFARAEAKARNEGWPEALKRQPKLVLRGVDFDSRVSEADLNTPHDVETELKQFAEQHAEAVVNLHVLPYTDDRKKLYSELSRASVALMLSWHEGFGLVGWEAIAAGVPLIIGENTGVYRFLEAEYPGAEKGYVHSLDVKAQGLFPFFRENDLEACVAALRHVASDPSRARKKAATLKSMLFEKHTWVSCCEDTVKVFGWDLQRGSVPDRTSKIVQQIAQQMSALEAPAAAETGPLKIPERQWRADAGMADSQLLRAEEAVLPFDLRRQPEVDELQSWVDDARWPVAVRLITGEGGQGKTRLAIHTCQQLRNQGWHSGFLDSSLEPNRMPSLWQDLRALNQPVFVVVDYAETRQGVFLALLKAALQNRAKNPMRMLLLARDGGEWWDTLPSSIDSDSGCEALLIGPATTGPFRITPLYAEQQDRKQAFTNAVKAFGEILGVNEPAVEPELVEDQFQRPLFVQMAALLSLYGERHTTVQGLTRAILNHERRYWVALLASLSWPEPGRRAEQLLALATLAGGFATQRFANKFWIAARRTDLPTGEFNLMFRRLATLYPGTQGLQALRPDLLGEALVAQSLLRFEGDALLDAVLGTSANQLIKRNALTVLARLSNDRADVDELIVAALSRQFTSCSSELVAVGTETVSRLPELAEIAFQRLYPATKSQVAGLLRHALPTKSVQLGGLSCLVFAHLAERARERFAKKPYNVERAGDYAAALYNYGLDLNNTGRYEEARETFHLGLEIIQPLVSKDRERFEKLFADFQCDYAISSSFTGNDDAALTHDLEAVQIYDRLRKKDPEKFGPDYARALMNYSTHLSEVGTNKEALAQLEIVLEIYRSWWNKFPERFADKYARSLDNYARELTQIGSSEKALLYSLEAIAIRKPLAQKNPDRFEPGYAHSLGAQAIGLANMGHFNEALTHARMTLEILERLAQKQPKRYGSSLLNVMTYVRFLSWLCHSEGGPKHHVLHSVLTEISPLERDLWRLYSAFVDACTEREHERRRDHFGFILSIWDSLPRRSKTFGTPYRLCAAAWSAKFNGLTETDWLSGWREYSTNRNGNVPVWMLEVARRLQFEFPQ